MPLINFSGLASGIDSEALIDATSDAARATRVDPHEEKIAELEDTNTSLEDLKTQLTTLQSQIREFANINGGGVVKLGKSTDETVITATASNAATNGSYTLTATQLAQNGTFSFNSSLRTYSASDDAINPDIDDGQAAVDRTVSVTVGTETVDVVLTSTTTLSEFVTSYNSSATNSTASVINIGTTTPDYRVIIVGDETGTTNGSISVSVGTEITAPNLGGDAAWDDNTLDDAQDAQFTLGGVGDTITRNSNTISDLIPGVTFTLESVGSATITVADDVAATTAAVEEFINTYNEIVEFVNENNQITREENGEDVDNIFGPLSSTRVDDGVLTSIRNDIVGSTYDSGTTARIFADLGITTERDGTLKFDKDEFETAMSEESSSVKEILANFADSSSLTGGTLDQYIRFNGLIDVVTTSNSSQIDSLNDQIARAEIQIARNEELMRQRFARLEAVMSRMQSQQQALTSALAGLAA